MRTDPRKCPVEGCDHPPIDNPGAYDVHVRTCRRKRKTTPKAWQYRPREVFQIRLARWFAELKGYTIDAGAWIHAPSGKPVAQGWSAFYDRYRPAIRSLLWEGAERPEGAARG